MESGIVGFLILIILRGMGWLYYLCPVFLKSLWSFGLGFSLRAARVRADVVRQNLAIAFPNNPEKRVRLFNEAYCHLGHLILEILMLFGPMKRFVIKNVIFSGLEHWEEAKKRGLGAIFLASHVGNWEIMAAGGAVLHGIDIQLVTKHLKPEWLHRAIELGRKKCGVDATYEPRTLRDVLRHLKKNGTVGMVLDQYAGAPVGVRVPVFGVPVGTMTAVAMLARRTGAAVLPVVNYRTSDGRVLVEIRPAIPLEQNEDPLYALAASTARFAADLERDILNHPGQWLWIHRRFKGDLGPLRAEEWSKGRSRR